MIVTYSLSSSEIEKIIAEHFGVTQPEVALVFSENENVNATVKMFKAIERKCPGPLPQKKASERNAGS